MKIVRLESENVKRLHAIQIKPDGSIIVVGGKNAQGKSSVLDSIEMALGGNASIPPQPIHKGESKARVVLDLEDIIVTRMFNQSGTSTLVIKDKNGMTKSSPQSLLDSLTGKLTFDPLGFIKMKADEQVKIVKQLAGVDFSKLDQEKQRIYEERTSLSREIKHVRAKIGDMPKYDNVPEKEVSIGDIAGELDHKTRINNKNQQMRQELTALQNQVETSEMELNIMREEITKLRVKWDMSLKRNEEIKLRRDMHFETVRALKDEDVKSLREQLNQADDVNLKVRSNLKRSELLFDLNIREQRSETITKRLDAIENEKLNLLSSSKLPIQGLTFDSDTLYYNGVPFQSQSSSAEQLRVSVAMGFAMNPKLKVLLIRDGSLLDNDNLKLVAEMAEVNNGQVWIERVGEGKECQVIIEDGKVKE